MVERLAATGKLLQKDRVRAEHFGQLNTAPQDNDNHLQNTHDFAIPRHPGAVFQSLEPRDPNEHVEILAVGGSVFFVQ